MKKKILISTIISSLLFGGIFLLKQEKNHSVFGIQAVQPEGLSSITFTIAKTNTNAYQANGMHAVGDNLSPNKSILDEMNNNNGLVTSISKLAYVYPGNQSGGPGAASDALKFGKSKGIGKLTLSTQHAVHKVVIQFATWSDSKNSQLKVNDVTGVAVARTTYGDETFTLSTPTNSITIETLYPSSGDTRILISRIDLYHYCSL